MGYRRLDPVRTAMLLLFFVGAVVPQVAAAAETSSTPDPSTSVPAPSAQAKKEVSLTPSTTKPYYACPQGPCGAIIDPTVARSASRFALPAGGPLLEGSGEKGGFSPADLQSAYNIPTTGGSELTIAVVDAYGYSSAESDLATYREKYELPACTHASGCFRKVNQKGEEANYPYIGGSLEESWEVESALDLDMVSAACPNCHILLVEATTQLPADTSASVNKAVALGATAVSNSYGYPEHYEPWCGKTGCSEYAASYSHAGIPIVASSGDSGFENQGEGASFPASAPGAIAVGGTSLHKAENTRGWSEEVWRESGGGCSAFEAKTAWQSDPSCAKRTDNDVAAVAACETPVSVYSTPGIGGWGNVCGTSASSPLIAGLEGHATVAARNEGAEAFYRVSMFDVTTGINGYCGHSDLCEAEEGYDGPTGWGAPNGPLQGTPGFRAITGPATNITAQGAQLNGYVNPGSTLTSASYHFEYGRTTAYGTTTPVSDASVGTGNTWKGASQTITGLHILHGTYHYRLVVTRGTETIYGADRTFTTQPWRAQTTPEPEGITEGSLQSVSCVSASACTAVSSYAYKLETRLALIERWNGSAWSTQSSPKPVGASQVDPTGVSCVSSTVCTMVGHYNTATKEVPLVERWNGTEWTLQTPAKEEGGLQAVSCISTTECIAVGGKASERWNGTEWLALTGGGGSGLSCTGPTFCMAVGSGLSATSWNGVEWLSRPPAVPSGAKSSSLQSVSCATSTACTAVGYYVNSLSHFVPLAERWNGTEWQVQATPELPIEEVGLSGVSCPTSTECDAVGGGPNAEHWDGSEWTVEGVQNPPEPPGFDSANLSAVSCLASTECVAVGGHIARQEGIFGFTGPFAERRSPIKPSATSGQATSITETAATLNGIVGPEGFATTTYFEYGPTTAYGTKTAEVAAGSGTGDVEEAKSISALSASTTYHFRIVAVGPNGTTNGADQTFSTRGKPSVETKAASALTTTGATLNGSVNPRASETKYFFEYGTTVAYGSKTAETSVGSGIATLEVSKALTELNPSTTYHYRIVATNGVGTAFGSDQAFTTVTPAWSVVTTPNPSGATVTGFGGPYIGGKIISCTSSTACTAVGHYKNSSGVFVTLAERWNGSSWSIQTTPNPSGAKESYLDGVSCTSATSCTAVGFYKNSESVIVSLAERWNGSEWSIQTTPNPAEGFEVRLRDVSCASASECIAVGRYSTKTGEFTLAERWNGTAWSIQTTGNKGVHRNWLYSVSCPSSSLCVAVGYYTKEVGGNALMTETWNGSKWETQEPPTPSGGTEPGLDSVSCSGTSECTAVGWYKNSSTVFVPLAERWNGSSWAIQTTPSPSGSTNNFLASVSCVTSTSCTGVGYDQNSAGTYVTLSESWNGSSWSIQSSPNPTGAKESALDGVACLSIAVCNSVGSYVNSSGTEVSLGETYK